MMPAVAENLAPATPDLRSRFPGGVRLVADDLTGACDAAVAFIETMEVRVWLGAQASCAAPEPVQAFTTNSRALNEQAAAELTREAFRAFAERGDVLAFKKIDSCMRGPVAAEVMAAHEALGTRTIVMTPAFPAAERTVSAGVLEIRDGNNLRTTPLHEHFANELLPHIAIMHSVDDLRVAQDKNKTILLCDAREQQDLKALAAWELTEVLYAGSAGLAYALAGTEPRTEPSSGLGERLPQCGQALVICGTNHAVTVKQLEVLEHIRPLASPLKIRAEAEDAAVILEAFHRHKPEGLVLTGGDTALLVLQTLGADSILLKGEFAAGIPWGLIQGGIAHGRVVVTKSGGFGTADTLAQIVRAMEEKV